ncbi:MAG TPA: PH domain-containing protein, partial [Acidimicrobiales bacterium]|nr:PH domain-containing protein [Acidimicrobiales bacterium]
LQIESGVLKRDARQLPMARVQAVDLARPFFARIFGLAELRVRLAGHSRTAGRLAYLAEPVAEQLRAQLLAVHHGVSADAPQPTETALLSVPTNRLVAASLLSGTSFAALALIVLAVLLPGGGGAQGAYAGTVAVYILAFFRVAWRRVAEQYRFTVALAPDGIRIRRGLFSTLNETVPFARVQAVRKVQPLLWRPFGWCVLEVDVAGSPGREQGTGMGRVTKALIPVGPSEQADQLLVSLLGLHQFQLSKPPSRARWKTPASYHFLAAGTDGYVVAATTGRLRKSSVWLPLQKAQSVRWVQGRFKLATVVVDAAGRRARAELRDRDVEEARITFSRLVDDSRRARQRPELK